MQLRPIVAVKGAATFIPGVMRFACGGSGGTDSARYCYSTWMRHLVRLHEAGVTTRFDSVAELGPGDSLGIGFSAILTGAARYFALDAIQHARTASNLRTLDDLVTMFENRESIPTTEEFPEIRPAIPSTRFPRTLMPDALMSRTLSSDRVHAIRAAVQLGRSDGIEVQYFAPWSDAAIVKEETVDLAFSQAVLEHVEDIDATYAALFRWLKPGGVMSHLIDFRSHSLTRDWFGHWTVPHWLWRIVKGRRPYLINRRPASVHLDAMRRHGFEIIQCVPETAPPPDRRTLAADFRDLTDDDLRTATLYVIARKPA